MTSPSLLERAQTLHRAHPVVECHADIPIDVRRRRLAGERAPLCDDYAKRLRAGGVRFQFLAVGGDVPGVHGLELGPHETARRMIGDVLDEQAGCPDLRIVLAASDLDAAIAVDQIGVILHFEGLKPVLDGGAEQAPPLHVSSNLRDFHELGLRSVQLTWNGRNELADGVGVPSPRGLSPLGRELVAELDRLGILIDVSHLAEPGFWNLVEIVRGPIVASHANTAAVCPHARNLTDEQLRAIARSGGFIGVCFIAAFIGEPASLERLLDHVDHIVGLVGVDAVAVGPDYVEFALDLMVEPGEESSYLGPEGLRRVETLPVFTAGLLARGYSEDETAKIVGGNALRVLRAVL